MKAGMEFGGKQIPKAWSGATYRKRPALAATEVNANPFSVSTADPDAVQLFFRLPVRQGFGILAGQPFMEMKTQEPEHRALQALGEGRRGAGERFMSLNHGSRRLRCKRHW